MILLGVILVLVGLIFDSLRPVVPIGAALIFIGLVLLLAHHPVG